MSNVNHSQKLITQHIKKLDHNESDVYIKTLTKRDKFGFKVVQFQPLMSNQASSVLCGTYSSQLVKYSRICNNIEAFSDRVFKITDD